MVSSILLENEDIPARERAFSMADSSAEERLPDQPVYGERPRATRSWQLRPGMRTFSVLTKDMRRDLSGMEREDRSLPS